MKVLVGIPNYAGQVSVGTMNSIMAAASGSGHDVMYQIRGISLLARNFSTLWADAWNNKFDVFVLLHSDIGVSPDPTIHSGQSWLDVLVGQCMKLQAAAISAVVPIKSAQGHTSLALGLDPDSPHPLRRVTVKELAQLPKDFIAREDICKLFGVDPATVGPMLINTGVLAMNLRGPNAPDWTLWPGFSICDEIAFNKSGRVNAYTVSEDWGMSRWMWQQGWRYFATQQLLIEHYGFHSYNARGNWGDEHDECKRQLPIPMYKETE